MRQSEDLAESANAILASLTQNEKVQWQTSDATKALKLVAEACLADLQESWMSGAFTYETAEATAMKNAEMLGTARAWAEVLEFISEITQDEEQSE